MRQAHHDAERHARIVAALRDEDLDALVCSLPSHVLLLTGYWPVMGSTIAIFTSDGRVHLLVPEDEAKLAKRMCAVAQTTFETRSLDVITTAEKAIAAPLCAVMRELGLENARIGIETTASIESAPCLALHLYGGVLRYTLQTACMHLAVRGADALLQQMKSTKTPLEMEKMRVSCRIAEDAFMTATRQIAVGMLETEVAAAFESAFMHTVISDAETVAGGTQGHFSCMSGPNSTLTYAAYTRAQKRRLEHGDLVMIHCNSCAGGFWAGLTRTYTMGEPDAKQNSMRKAISLARAAALDAIRPGAYAADVDKAARDVLAAHGFGAEFKHGIGHGVGFSPANHDALPRLHPRSLDVLQPGMTFKIEPAVYLKARRGMRHCDVVAVSATGVEVLTGLQMDQAGLALVA